MRKTRAKKIMDDALELWNHKELGPTHYQKLFKGSRQLYRTMKRLWNRHSPEYAKAMVEARMPKAA